jgi:hypothetical protein
MKKRFPPPEVPLNTHRRFLCDDCPAVNITSAAIVDTSGTRTPLGPPLLPLLAGHFTTCMTKHADKGGDHRGGPHANGKHLGEHQGCLSRRELNESKHARRWEIGMHEFADHPHLLLRTSSPSVECPILRARPHASIDEPIGISNVNKPERICSVRPFCAH